METADTHTPAVLLRVVRRKMSAGQAQSPQLEVAAGEQETGDPYALRITASTPETDGLLLLFLFTQVSNEVPAAVHLLGVQDGQPGKICVTQGGGVDPHPSVLAAVWLAWAGEDFFRTLKEKVGEPGIEEPLAAGRIRRVLEALRQVRRHNADAPHRFGVCIQQDLCRRR